MNYELYKTIYNWKKILYKNVREDSRAKIRGRISFLFKLQNMNARYSEDEPPKTNCSKDANN